MKAENSSALKVKSDATSALSITGFYTTRIVRANGEEDAVTAAILLTEAELDGYGFTAINSGKEPEYGVEVVEELTAWGYLRAKPRRGFTFY